MPVESVDEVTNQTMNTRDIAPSSSMAVQTACDALLQGIEKQMKIIFCVLKRAGLSDDDMKIDAGVQRAMLVQSLRFLRNDSYTDATTKTNEFVDFRCRHDNDETKAQVQQVLAKSHAIFEHRRDNDFKSMLQQQRSSLLARRIVNTKDMWSFAGRQMCYCPTRGGPVWDMLLAQLQDPTIKNVPLRLEKIRLLFLGKFDDGGKTYAPLADGNGWAGVSPTLVNKFVGIIGKDELIKIDLAMRSTVCSHQYRPSDIANRHGFHVSHPNPRLNYTFGGFGFSLGRGAAP